MKDYCAFVNQRCLRQEMSSGGFTLLEVLVVTLIIGILATMAVLSVGSRSPATIIEARRLAELLRLAADEAVLQGQEWGLRITPEGYEFMLLEGATWQSAPDEILRPRLFSHEVAPRLLLEGEELIVKSAEENQENNDEENDSEKKKQLMPQLFILSSGESSPFQLFLTAPEEPTWVVIGNYAGNFIAQAAEDK